MSASEVAHAVPALVLGSIALAMVIAVPASAQAKALASASMNITNFVWYNATAGRPVTLSTSDADGTDVVIVRNRGSDSMETEAGLSINGSPQAGSPDTVGFRTIERGMPASLAWTPNLPPTCISGSPGDCAAAPAGFQPIGDAFPGADFASSDADYEDFFAEVTASLANAGASVGLRADASLDTAPPAGGAASTASATTEWDTAIVFDAQRTFDSYFVLEFQSQALARLDDAPGSAFAETSFIMAVSEQFGSTLQPVFNPGVLNVSASRSDAGVSQDGTYTTTQIFSYGSDPNALYTLNFDERYTLSLVASVSANGQLEALDVPAPAALWLLLSGISSIWAVRSMPLRRAGSRTPPRVG